MKIRVIGISLLSAALLSACSIHKVDIQQGNIITEEMMERIKPGMDRQQVKFVLGTPPVADPFHPERWDYYYSMKTPDKPYQQKRFTLFFGDDGKLARIVHAPTNNAAR